MKRLSWCGLGLLLSLSFVVGCGNSASYNFASPDPQPAVRVSQKVSVDLEFEPRVSAKGLPASTERAEVRLLSKTSGQDLVPPQTVIRPPGVDVMTVVFENVPLGEYEVVVVAYDAAGNVTGYSFSSAEVNQAGQSVTIRVDDQSNLQSLLVTPPVTTLEVGGSVPLMATASFTGGRSVEVSGLASWTSSNPAVANVTSSGLVTAVASGNVEIIASVGPISGRVQVAVSAPSAPTPPAPTPTPTQTPTPDPTPTVTPTVTPTPPPFVPPVTPPVTLSTITTFRSDRLNTGRSGFSTSANLGQLIWSAMLPPLKVSSPVVGSDGTVYVSSENRVDALNSADGSIKWTTDPGGSVGSDKSSVSLSPDGKTLYSTYTNPWSYMGTLSALQTSNGAIKWQYISDFGLNLSSPNVGSDGTVYVGARRLGSAQGGLLAVNPSGTVKWAYRNGEPMEGTPAIADDGTIYQAATGGSLYAFTPGGAVKWTYHSPGSAMESSPAIGSDGTVYVGTGSRTNISSASAPDQYFMAFAPDGNLKWAYPLGGNTGNSPAIASDGSVYMFTTNGRLHSFDGADGSLKWLYTFTNTPHSPTLGSEGTIYFSAHYGSADDRLFAVTPQFGFKWAYSVGVYGTVVGTPGIGPDGTVYAPFQDGYNSVIRSLR